MRDLVGRRRRRRRRELLLPAGTVCDADGNCVPEGGNGGKNGETGGETMTPAKVQGGCSVAGRTDEVAPSILLLFVAPLGLWRRKAR